MKKFLLKLLSLITVVCIMASLCVVPVSGVEAVDGQTSEYDPLLTTEYTFSNLNDVRENFTCFSYKTESPFGTFDSEDNAIHAADGTPSYTETDPSLAWKVDTKTGGLIRQGSGNYVAGRQTRGASLLYFDAKYSEFEVEFEYCFSKVSNSYRWAGVGFGASNLGDNFQLDSYFAVVEQEGTVRLHRKGDTKLSWLNTGANEKYKTAVKDDLINNTDTWHNMRVSVIGGRCYISYDGNGPYEHSVNTDAGYVYLFSNTEGMKLRNIRLSKPLVGSLNDEYGKNTDEGKAAMIDVWPEEYGVNAKKAITATDISQESKKFSFAVIVNNKKTRLSVTFPTSGGVRICGEKAGFFEPDDVQEITYKNVSNGVELTSGGEKLLFTYSSGGWKLLTYKSGQASVYLGSDNLVFGYKNDGTLGRIGYTFPITDGELFYGLGERYNAVNQNGYTMTLWNHDATYHVGGSDLTTKTESYANVPILHSTNGYTLFFNSSFSAEADIGYTDPEKCVFDFNGNILDLYIFNGTPAENTASYTAITGRPFVAPEWAYGYWAGAAKAVYTDQNGDDAVTAEDVNIVLQSISDNYNALGIKPSALYSEGTYIDNWQSTFPLVTANGMKVLSWNRCSISYDKMIKNLDVSATLLPLIRSKSDPLKFFGNAGYAYIDYSNPVSKTLVKNLYSDMAAAGLRGLMVDMGEYIWEDSSFYNGKNGDEMHNLYSYYYGKTINEAFTELVGKDFALFQRSGSAGSQSNAILFGGDQRAEWYGMRQQLNGMLTSAASGFSLYGADIGGLQGKPTDELYSRWVQLSAFSPIMREHGNHAEDTLPWTYSEVAQANLVKYYNVREAIRGYIYSSALESGKTGIPIAKSLAFAYPEQTSLHAIEDEYIFCDSLLVAPVMTKDATQRTVALPSGKWYDFYKGTALNGGVSITASAPTDSIPVYVKSGSAIPLSLSEKLSVTESGDVSVMLITPPEQESVSVINKDQNTAFEYRISPLGEKAFEFEKPDGDGVKTLMIYGVKATNVCVNGNDLKISENGSEGFVKDGANTVIYLSSDEAANIEIYTAGMRRKNKVNDITPKSTEELYALSCYAVDGSNNIEATDSNGNSLFKQVGVSDIWTMPYPGVIERQSIDKYTTTGSRKGVSALYLDGRYTDFELKMSYCYNGATGSWRWLSVGFGAENVGDTYYDSGYLALVEQEGTVKLLGDAQNGSISTYRMYNTQSSEYMSSIVSKPLLWHEFTLRVVGNTVSIGYDGNEYTVSNKTQTAGLIYLHCFTNNIRFKDITVTDLSGKVTYSGYDRFELKCEDGIGGKIECDEYAFYGQKIELSLSPDNGYLCGETVKLMGHNGEKYIVTELYPDQNGKYNFTMPAYPITLSADFYISSDVNASGMTDILDLIRLKKHLVDKTKLIHSLASDINADEAVDALDLAELKKILLK